MKKLIYTIMLISTTFSINETYAQDWNTSGNTTFATDWLGTQNNLPLRIRTNSTERFKIMQGGIGSAAGRVAIGNNLAVGFTPLSRLHLHQTAAVNTIRFTTDNMVGGNGFEVGYDATSNVQNQQYAEIHNRENTAMKFFTTGNNQRMHINQNRQSILGSYNNIPTSGYVGIGRNTGNIWGTNIAIGSGPYTLLHLNNDIGSPETNGYRPWMRGGVSFTENVDFGYVGMRPFFDNSGNFGNANIIENRNEFVIAWANNPNTGSVGSDDLCFRFTSNVDGFANSINTGDLFSPSDLDGRHIARFTALGNMGLGPTFGEDNPVYVVPQSLLHMSRDQQKDTWLQVTNQTGTGQTAADGLRIGITTTGTAHIRQQEILPLIFYTGAIEDARIVPQSALTLPATNHGMIGLGDWTTAFNILPANVINAKLDIDGDLRIRTVTQDNTLTQILAIDPTDHNRVHWIDGSNLGGNVTADNGLSINPANNVQLGNDVGLTTAQLLNDREIPMNGNNIMLNDAANSTAALTIGHPLGTANPTIGKFEVINDSYRIGGLVSSVGSDPIAQIGFFSQALHTGVSGNATAINANCLGATGSGIGIGVNSISRGTTSEFNIAFNADVANGTIHSISGNLDVLNSNSPLNIGMQVDIEDGTNPTAINYGAQVLIDSPGNVNYGYFCSVTGASTNWAGWFNGNVFVSGSVGPSDANLKTNVESLDNAMDVINQLNPVSFDFDNSIKPRLNLQQGKQYGLIAQEVETILPEMVGSTTLPAEYDSLGNEIDASFDFKTLDYEKFVPILIAGMKEQQNNLNTKDSLINNLESRLTYLESCIRNANICEEGNRAINQNPATETNYRSVELTNNNSIILDQNSPNPFAENTIINYNIPTDVVEAKLMFYDLNGRIIKELIIEERGESKLTVYGTNLKTGVYTYSLIADGELIATKKMVKK